MDPVFVGHEEYVREFLRRKEEGALPHCLLITGPQGVGKARLAKDLAKIYLAGDQKDQSDLQVESGNHPDFHQLCAGEETIKKQEIVDLIEESQKTSYLGGRQVFLIQEADQLTVQGQNALLKTLEEPQSQVAIFLTAVHEGQLLDTIVSRARIIPLHPVREEDLLAWLKDQGYGTKESLKDAVSLSGGCLEKALAYLEDEDWIQLRAEFFQKIQDFKRKSRDFPFVLTEDLLNKKAYLKDFLLLMTQYYRDVLVYKALGDQDLIIHRDKLVLIQGETLKNSSLYTIIKDIQESLTFLEKNGNSRLVLEGLFIKIQEEYL